jgi:hypothetical protein
VSEIIKRIIKSDSSNKYLNRFCALNEALIKQQFNESIKSETIFRLRKYKEKWIIEILVEKEYSPEFPVFVSVGLLLKN